MKVLFSTAVFAVAAIGGGVGLSFDRHDEDRQMSGRYQLMFGRGRSLDRQDPPPPCNTAKDAILAIGDAIYGCGIPDMVFVM